MKSLAVSKLRDIFSGQYSHCGPEVSLDVSDTRSGVNKRIADSAIRFEEQHPLFKSGLIIEIQFKNKGKSILETAKDYLKKGTVFSGLTPRISLKRSSDTKDWSKVSALIATLRTCQVI